MSLTSDLTVILIDMSATLVYILSLHVSIMHNDEFVFISVNHVDIFDDIFYKTVLIFVLHVCISGKIYIFLL